ncbi:MAG: methionine--tRNA ligase [Thermoprotei archaeon]|nr:methionine--tRNA ligase [TACK group archaeon]
MQGPKWIVTAAWPYVNYEPHLGTLIHLLSADAFSRYLKMNGEEAVSVSGSDEHGTPIEVEAMRRGISPRELTDANHGRVLQILKEWEIQLDNYTRTESEVHKKFVQDFYSKVYDRGFIFKRDVEMPYCEEKKMFLPDRFVVGTCPYCGYPEAHGDQCDNCGRLLEPKLLINPRGVFCDGPLTWKTTNEWDFDLASFSQQLESYIRSNDRLPDNARAQSLAMIREGLKPRSVTRDNSWGIPAPFPGAEGKTIYVWMEAVLGYVSATKEYYERLGKPTGWMDLWSDPASRFVCFIGKDNIPFHTIILPALLLASGDDYVLPWTVSTTEFILFGGEKASKSKKRGIWSTEALSAFPAEDWRFVLMQVRPEGKDVSITFQSVASRINADLNDTLGNYLHRTLAFAYANFGGKVPQLALDDESRQLLMEAEERSKSYREFMERTSLQRAVEELLALARSGNRYFNGREPWKQLSSNPQTASTTAYVGVEVAKDLAVMLYPFAPAAATLALSFLGMKPSWETLSQPIPPGTPMLKPRPLFSKVTEPPESSVTSPEQSSQELVLPPIDISDFSKLDIRIGRVVSAERVAGSKKLLRIRFDLGGFTKTTLGGLGLKYDPDELIGKKVAVLVNIRERDMMGEKSQCMVLAAEGPDGSLGILVPMRDVPEGSRVR